MTAVPTTTEGYGCKDANRNFELVTIPLPPFTSESVYLTVKYCGICHSDCYLGEWVNGKVDYPCVPGHEIIGEVKAVGAEVKSLKVGDLVGVGCMISSCLNCETCKGNEEQFCKNKVYTYQSRHHNNKELITKGGYSKSMIVDAHFCLQIPEAFRENLAAVAPLLCAGITGYEPLVYHGFASGTKKRVGVIGLGGLGSVAVKIAKAMGHDVCVISHSENKRPDAERMKAEFAIIKDKSSPDFEKYTNHFDYIYDTVSANKDLMMYFALAARDCVFVVVGVPPLNEPMAIHPFPFLQKRLTYTGSAIGGIKRTQEMLEFCAKNNITADVEVINPAYIRTAFERIEKSDVKFRFTIDMQQ